MAARKRKPTKKQLAALARGRAKMKAKRKRVKRAAPKRTRGRKAARRPSRRALGYIREKKTMAKKRRKSTRRRSTRRTGGGGRRGGFLSGIEWKDMAGAAAYGYLENQVKEKPADALLKKVPLFYAGIGYAGCLGLLAHFAGKQMGGAAGAALRHLSKGTLDVAAYKLMRNGELYKDEAAADAALAGDEMGFGALGDDAEVGFTDDPDAVSGDDDEVGYGADGPGY
jgi:hypothetical protein